jgi:hypothetical protein
MVRRYVIPSVLIVAVALGAGGLSYAGSKETRVTATCGFKVVIHLANAVVQTPDYSRFIAFLALEEVGSAVGSGVYGQVAARQRVNTAVFSRNVRWRPSAGLGTFALTVPDTAGPRAGRLANATCDQMVATIKAHRTATVDSQIKVIQSRIDSSQKELSKLTRIRREDRTNAQAASLATLSDTILGNSRLIASIRSLPPDEIAVIARAAGAETTTTGSLNKNLLIALVAALFVCFLYILVLEIIAERKRQQV